MFHRILFRPRDRPSLKRTVLDSLHRRRPQDLRQVILVIRRSIPRLRRSTNTRAIQQMYMTIYITTNKVRQIGGQLNETLTDTLTVAL